jgi:hypothetical protein
MKELTSGSISIVTDGAISIRAHQEASGIENGSYVLIIRSRSGFLRVIPLEDGYTVQVRASLSLSAFAHASRKLYEQIRKAGLRLLHSTGFCPLEDSCIWEGYFHVRERSKVEEFVTWLHELDVVLEAEAFSLDDASAIHNGDV